MNDNKFPSVIESLMKSMDAALSAKTVVGEPTQIGDTIIIPLVDVSFGIGAGASSKEKKEVGGGGVGGKMSPSAVLIIRDGYTKIVNVGNQDLMSKVLDMIPELVDRLTAPKPEVSESDAADIAFPDGMD